MSRAMMINGGQGSNADRMDVGMVGTGPALQALRKRIDRLARAPGGVLILGETGSGKELAARALHAASPRHLRAFVALNCAAVPRELVEAELFGSTAGAFTGARPREGLFRKAHRGTLFLDEIGDLALPAQAALLRVIETGCVRPLGSDDTLEVDCRLLCATHRDLRVLAAAGGFRSDLYHRIATYTVTVPPLRDRPEDLPALAEAVAGPEVERLTPAAWRALKAHRWPGNVRELRNVLLRALAITDGPIEPEDLDLEVPLPQGTGPARGSLRARIAHWARQEVDAHGGNLRAAARTLGISPTTLYRYLAEP